MRQFRVTHCLATFAVAALALAGSAQASVLYDSPSSGFANGFSFISSDYFAENTFTLGASATVVGVEFDSWTLQGDTVASVDWAILDANRVALETGTAEVSSVHFAVNLAGDDINFNQFSIPALSLAAGDYWLQLTNAISNGDHSVGWDRTLNSQSQSFGTDGAQFPNTFEIFGADPDRDGPPAGGVPEPATWALLIGGFGLAGATLRRRRSAVAA